MRMVAMVLGLALGSAPIVVLADGAGGGGRRVTRCCLELELPGIPPVPVCVQVRDPHAVSAEFEGVPLAEALHRLLGDQNFALVYGNQGRLKSVRLLGGPQTAAAAAPIPAAAAPPAGQPSAPGIVDAFAKHAPIAVAGHLGEALGGHEASLLQLFDLSVHN